MKKLITIFFLVAIVQSSFGQGERFKPSFNSPFSLPKEFLKTQWFLGFKFGTNLSPVTAKTRIYGFSPINYEVEELDKDYSSEWGGHAGIDITFYSRGFSVGIQPNFRRQSYSYTTTYVWGTDPDIYTSEQQAEQRLDLLDFPVFMRYDVTQTAMRPFVLAGLYYSVLTAAEKAIQITSTDARTDPPTDLGTELISLSNKTTFNKNSSGYILGGGISYDPGNIRVVLDLQYRDSFGSITDKDAGFDENQLASIGDVDDEVSLRNLNLSISFLFPLRFISDDFTSNF